jgi:signal transduction histidine kinase
METTFIQQRNMPYESKSYDLLGIKAADQIEIMLSYWDAKGICRYANNAFLKRFEVEREDLVNVMSVNELLGEDMYKHNLPHINNVLKGKKQVYRYKERVRVDLRKFSIITYYPDFQEDEVVGFFARIFDVKPFKEQETRLNDTEKLQERDVLRSIIETKEMEKEMVAYQLKESVNQTLAYCKVMVESLKKQYAEIPLLTNFSSYLHLAIDELNDLSNNMSPSLIKLLGLKAGVQDAINLFEATHKVKVFFKCEGDDIEQVGHTSKLTLFRIIQDCLLMFTGKKVYDNVFVEINYSCPAVKLKLVLNEPSFEVSKQGKYYLDITNRVECYGGKCKEIKWKNLTILEIELPEIY